MKLQSTLLAITMLLVASLAGAAPSSTPADAANAIAAEIFSAPGSPDCAKATLPSFEPTPTQQTSNPCGTCSDSLCQGKQAREFCKSQNGQIYTCQRAYIVCAVMDCQCWYGPLP